MISWLKGLFTRRSRIAELEQSVHTLELLLLEFPHIPHDISPSAFANGFRRFHETVQLNLRDKYEEAGTGRLLEEAETQQGPARQDHRSRP